MYFFKHHKLVHWIAALAILLSALAPAVSQALSLANSGQGFVVEICSSNGSKMTQVISEDETSSSPAMGSHCPYCVVQPIYLLPNIGAFEFLASSRYLAQAQSDYQTPRTSSGWLRLPSRAPPAHT